MLATKCLRYFWIVRDAYVQKIACCWRQSTSSTSGLPDCSSQFYLQRNPFTCLQLFVIIIYCGWLNLRRPFLRRKSEIFLCWHRNFLRIWLSKFDVKNFKFRISDPRSCGTLLIKAMQTFVIQELVQLVLNCYSQTSHKKYVKKSSPETHFAKLSDLNQKRKIRWVPLRYCSVSIKRFYKSTEWPKKSVDVKKSHDLTRKTTARNSVDKARVIVSSFFRFRKKRLAVYFGTMRSEPVSFLWEMLDELYHT